MYKLLRSFLFLFDPEWVHYFSMNLLKLACKIPFKKKALQFGLNPREMFNIQYSIFNSQTGLALVPVLIKMQNI